MTIVGIKLPRKKVTPTLNKLNKCLTGNNGFDEVTEGGLPKNRTSLISGGAGSGKTFLGLIFQSMVQSITKNNITHTDHAQYNWRVLFE